MSDDDEDKGNDPLMLKVAFKNSFRKELLWGRKK
jgi:hypothetical protein